MFPPSSYIHSPSPIFPGCQPFQRRLSPSESSMPTGQMASWIYLTTSLYWHLLQFLNVFPIQMHTPNPPYHQELSALLSNQNNCAFHFGKSTFGQQSVPTDSPSQPTRTVPLNPELQSQRHFVFPGGGHCFTCSFLNRQSNHLHLLCVSFLPSFY